MSGDAGHAALEREEAGLVLAALVASCGDFDLAEEAFHDSRASGTLASSVSGSPSRAARKSAWAAPDPRARAERLVVAGFVLTYLAAIGWLALRAVRWLIEG